MYIIGNTAGRKLRSTKTCCVLAAWVSFGCLPIGWGPTSSSAYHSHWAAWHWVVPSQMPASSGRAKGWRGANLEQLWSSWRGFSQLFSCTSLQVLSPWIWSTSYKGHSNLFASELRGPKDLIWWEMVWFFLRQSSRAVVVRQWSYKVDYIIIRCCQYWHLVIIFHDIIARMGSKSLKLLASGGNLVKPCLFPEVIWNCGNVPWGSYLGAVASWHATMRDWVDIWKRQPKPKKRT